MIRRATTILAVLALGAQLVAQSSSRPPIPHPSLESLEPAVADQLREARRAFDAGRGDAAAYAALARLYHAYQFFEEAEAAYLHVIRLAPHEGDWPHLLGYLYQQTGQHEQAARWFVEARRVSPGDHAATLRLGEVYLALNRVRDAREQFERVRLQFPALARQGLGECALREGRFDEAIGHFEAVLERMPQAAAIHYPLAMAYRGAGRLDEARTHLARRGTAGISIGDPIVDALDSLITGERGLVAQGRRAFESRQLDAAARAFAQALALAPDSAAARGNLGLVLAAQGRDAEALDHLRRAFAATPEDASIGRGLSGVLLRLGRVDDAIGVLTDVQARHADDEDALVGLAILLSNRQRYRDAIALLERATRARQDQRMATTTLARLLASAPDRTVRDAPRALTLAMAVYAAEPTAVHAETVAMALAGLRRCDEALAWSSRAAAAAKAAGDPAETARLEGELATYRATPCGRL